MIITENIKNNEFATKNIEELVIYSKNIGDYAFYCSKIKKLVLNEGIETIGERAFFNNQIETILLPNSIKKIGPFAFNQSSIIYKNHKIEGNIVNQYDDFIKVADKVYEIIPTFDFNNATPETIASIYENKEYLKAYYFNLKNFKELVEKIKSRWNMKYINDHIVYKFCLILGYFTKNKDKVTEFILNYTLKSTFDEMNELVENLKVIKYYPNLAQLLMENIDNESFKKIFNDYYNNYKGVNKTINMRKSNKIRKNMINEKHGRKVEQISKKISVSDILNYYENRLNTSLDCEELKQIVPILSAYIDENQYTKVENIYRLSKLMEYKEQCFSYIEGKGQTFTYKWLKGSDPLNFIAGYLCNSCASLDDEGHDILTETMTNPHIKTMTIFLENRMVAKTTAYYNAEKEYLVFNNISVNKSFYNQISEGRRLTLLQDIISGIKMQVKAMNKKGYTVKDVRIGCEYTTLIAEIEKMKLETAEKNLSNFNFTSNNAKTQAILIKSK